MSVGLSEPQKTAWSRTKVTRPSGPEPKPKNSPSRKRLPTDAVMNEEWVSTQAPPIFSFELKQESRLEIIQEKLSALEHHALRAFSKPAEALRGLYRIIARYQK